MHNWEHSTITPKHSDVAAWSTTSNITRTQDLATMEVWQAIKLQHFIIRHLAFLTIPPPGPELSPPVAPTAHRDCRARSLPGHSRHCSMAQRARTDINSLGQRLCQHCHCPDWPAYVKSQQSWSLTHAGSHSALPSCVSQGLTAQDYWGCLEVYTH